MPPIALPTAIQMYRPIVSESVSAGPVSLFLVVSDCWTNVLQSNAVAADNAAVARRNFRPTSDRAAMGRPSADILHIPPPDFEAKKQPQAWMFRALPRLSNTSFDVWGNLE